MRTVDPSTDPKPSRSCTGALTVGPSFGESDARSGRRLSGPPFRAVSGRVRKRREHEWARDYASGRGPFEVAASPQDCRSSRADASDAISCPVWAGFRLSALWRDCRPEYEPGAAISQHLERRHASDSKAYASVRDLDLLRREVDGISWVATVYPMQSALPNQVINSRLAAGTCSRPPAQRWPVAQLLTLANVASIVGSAARKIPGLGQSPRPTDRRQSLDLVPNLRC